VRARAIVGRLIGARRPDHGGRAPGGARRSTLLVLAAIAAAVVFLIGPAWPKDQSIHVVLGDSAGIVDGVRLRYARADGSDDPVRDEPLREVALRYAPGQAPRIVSHEARLPDGDYRVELDVEGGGRVSTIARRIHLGGGSTSIDVSRDVAARLARKDEP